MSLADIATMRQYLLPSLVGLVVLIVSRYIIRFRTKRKWLHRTFERGHVPSIGNPKFFSGNLYETYANPENVFTVDKYHKQLGPTYGLFYGRDPWIQTTDLELLQKVFTAEDGAHVDRTLVHFPMSEFNKSMAQTRGDKWRHARRVIAPSFQRRRMLSDNVNNEVERVGAQLVELVEGHRGEKEQTARLDVYYAMKRYSLEIIFRLAFGRVHKERFSASERDELLDWLHEESEKFNSFAMQACAMFVPLRRLVESLVRFTSLGSFIAYIHSIIDSSIRVRGKSNREIGLKDRKMIDSLVECKKSGQMDTETFKANLYFMLLAGHETTAFALTCLLFELAWAQDKQEKLRRAVLDHGEQAEYLDWSVKEILRMYPAVPSGIGRVLDYDIEHKGMRLFKGTSVNASIWSIHRSKEYWGPDADQFRPERMGEPVDDQANPALKLRHFGFGHGPRYCVGQNLALSEIRSLITKFIARCKICPTTATPRQIECTAPNLYQWIIHHPVELAFQKLERL